MKYTFTLLLIFIVPFTMTGQSSLRPSTVGIVVNNADSAAEWYKRMLGFSLSKRMDFPEYDSMRIIFLQKGNFELELVQKKTSFSINKYVADYDPNKAPLQGIVKLTFTIPEVQKLFDTLKSKGVTIVMGVTQDKTFNTRFFMIEDNDHNLLQFTTPPR